MERVRCGVIAGCIVLGAAVGMPSSPVRAGPAQAAVQRPVVRLAVVNTPFQSGLLATLLPDFERASGYEVQVYSGNDVFQRAERGEADLVIAHLGKAGTEQFVRGGNGAWPRAVFSNQMVLVGPATDPAGILGMTDPFAAVRKIAEKRAPFVCAVDPGSRYLCELLLAGAGNPAREGWYLETTQSKGLAMKFAAERAAYTVWGAYPFERFRRTHATTLQAMVWDTSIFQRVMASIVVEPERFPAANAAGARALEAYLLSPQVQAAIAAFREDGVTWQTWWPAARSNNPAQLLGVDAGSDTDE